MGYNFLIERDKQIRVADKYYKTRALLRIKLAEGI